MKIFFFLMFNFSCKWNQVILLIFFNRSQTTIAFMSACSALLSNSYISAHYFIEFFVYSIRYTFLLRLITVIIISPYILVFWIDWICMSQQVYLASCILLAVQIKQFIMLFIRVTKRFRIYVLFLQTLQVFMNYLIL